LPLPAGHQQHAGFYALSTNLGNGNLIQHVTSALDAEELSSDPNYVRRDVAGNLSTGLPEDVRADEALERGGHVDVRARLLLNRLQHQPLPTSDNRVKLPVDLDRLGVQSAL
jgi:hypothetical protein